MVWTQASATPAAKMALLPLRFDRAYEIGSNTCSPHCIHPPLLEPPPSIFLEHARSPADHMGLPDTLAHFSFSTPTAGRTFFTPPRGVLAFFLTSLFDLLTRKCYTRLPLLNRGSRSTMGFPFPPLVFCPLSDGNRTSSPCILKEAIVAFLFFLGFFTFLQALFLNHFFLLLTPPLPIASLQVFKAPSVQLPSSPPLLSPLLGTDEFRRRNVS